jgi:hypothetical protein
MKIPPIVRLVKPINSAQRELLEQRIESEERRFSSAVRGAIGSGFSLRTLLREYPIETAIIGLLGGWFLARKLTKPAR